MQKNINFNNQNSQKFSQELNHPNQFIHRTVVKNKNEVEYSNNTKKLEKSPKFIYQTKNVTAQKTFRKDKQFSNTKNNFETGEKFNSSSINKDREIEELKRENAKLRAINSNMEGRFKQLYKVYLSLIEEVKFLKEKLKLFEESCNYKEKECESLKEEIKTCQSLIRKMAAILEDLYDEPILQIMEKSGEVMTVVYPDDEQGQEEFENLETQ